MKPLFSRKKTEKQREEQQKREETLFAENIVSFVNGEAEKRRNALRPFELQWRLNANFIMGNQHCDINVHRLNVENYQPIYDYMSREVFNRIAPIMETRRSYLNAVSYDVSVLPKTDSYSDESKAKVATALLNAYMKEEKFKSAYSKALGITESFGTAFFLSFWNSRGGKRVGTLKRTEINPENGEPLLIEEPEFEGDLDYTVLFPGEVLPEDLYLEELKEQRSLLIEQVKSVSEIYDLYGVRLEGKSIDSYGISETAGAGGLGYEGATPFFGFEKKENSLLLHTYMEKPSRSYPEGRLIITAGDTLLHYGVLPYESYPLCEMKSQSVSGQFYGKSVVEMLIPLQRSYNGIRNRMNDYINRSACGQLLIEDGSVDADEITENGLVPGEPIIYSRGAKLPSLLEEPKLSDLASDQCRQIASDMEYAAGVSKLMSGEKITGIASGSALEYLLEIDSARLAVYGENLRDAVLKLSKIWLSICRRYISEKRILENVGDNYRGAVTMFSGEDLSFADLVFNNENELGEKRALAREQYIEALSLGVFEGEDGKLSTRAKISAAKKLVGSISSEMPLFEERLQEQNARNENTDFEEGKELLVHEHDNHALHVEEHRLFVLQDRFRTLEKEHPEEAEPMLRHIREHLEKMKTEREDRENHGKTE